ncbi:radical SAM protein [uncultured Jatrophihabitans sp.]|uniref:radical SAM protein n=1 Tax=uncultured Jatrophihabitans sp. TaxID=1610747 RepID=UPI0035C96F63
MTRPRHHDPAGFRWKTADDGEPALFGVDELLIPDLGTGRMSDLEFLHVTAKRVLNHLPAGSRAPANWTINVYRGCSHACTYCASGDTPVLMADGTSRPIADLRSGDDIYGTGPEVGEPAGGGTSRRLVPTAVLDHWRTERPAWRLGLADGTALTASPDHRFRTEGGEWRRVCELRPGTRLLRADLVQTRRAEPPRVHQLGAVAVATATDLKRTMPMYDITTGTGDFLANGVVSHNCFARPTHAYLGFDIGEDFDRKIVVKINAVEKLRAELADPRWRGESVAMGTNTDPYQRAEAKYRLTRGVLQALSERGNPFSILTKSPLVTRDLDVLAEAADRADVSVAFSVGTLDERIWRLTEPGAPNPRRRIEAMARLADAGIRTGALVAPVLPGLSDSEQQLREVVAAVAAAGGTLLGIAPLHLRPGVREHFLGWLRDADPAMHADYERRYAASDHAPDRYLAQLYARAGIGRQPRRVP